MKRRVYESIFAATLAVAVALTNIPVTAFAAETEVASEQEQTVEHSADQEQTINQNQAENQEQKEDGNKDSQAGEPDSAQGTEDEQQNSGSTQAEQKVSGEENQQKPDDTKTPEAAVTENAAQNDEIAVLTTDESVWELNGGTISQSELKKKLGDTWQTGTYRWSRDGANWTQTKASLSNPQFTFESGEYEFQKMNYRGQWEDIGTKQIKVYYDITFSVSGTSEGAVLVDNNVVTTAKAYDGSLKFSVKQVKGYDVAVTADGQKIDAENEVYSLSVSKNTEVNIVYTPVAGADVTVEAEHAAVTINGTSANTARVDLNQSFPVVIKPEEGYAVEKVTVNGEKVPNLKFDDQYAASFNWNSGEENDAKIQITATVVKEKLVLKSNATVSYHKGMKLERLKSNIFNSVVDKDNSIPKDITEAEVEIQYYNGAFWKALDYEPGTFEVYAHAFGKNDTEKIRISYKGNSQGNSQYAPVSNTTTVTLSDERLETKVIIPEGITVQYNTEDVMNQELLRYISVQDTEGNTLPVDTSALTLAYDRTVGEQTLTVSYAGDDDYKGSSAQVAITITKGDAKVSVNSQKITYGETFATPVFTASPEEAKVIGLVAGITASGEKYVSMDLSNVTVNDIAGTKIPLYGDLSIQDVMKKMGMTSIKVGDLSTLFEKIQGMIDSGSDISGTIEGIEKVIAILEKIVPGIDDVTIHIGELPEEAGVYTAVGMTVNSNYNTAIGVGTLTIAQKKADVKLVFNQEITNKHHRLTPEEAADFDFGGHIQDGDVQSQQNVQASYIGKKADGETVAGKEPIREAGEYIETISVIGGNYLATPIVRSYTIGEEKTTIKFDKKIVSAAYDGNEHGMSASVYNEDGEKVGEAQLEYQNISTGLTQVSASAGAPTDAGVYRVIATYAGDENYPAADQETGTLIITKALARGVVTVGDAETTYGQKLNLENVIIQTENIAQRDITAIQSTLACAGNDDTIGSHAITVSIPESVSKNYAFAIKVNAGTHKINAKEITITADSCKVQYGDPMPEFTYQMSGAGKDENIGEISVVKKEDGNHVGTYTLDVQVSNPNPNYQYKLETGTLTIKKRGITISIDKKQKVKGQKDPVLTYTVEGNGLVEGDTLGIYLSRKSGEKAGLYDIYMDASHLNSDYELINEPSGKDKFEIVENKSQLTDDKGGSGDSDKTGTQVKSTKKQPGTVWDRIKTGDNNKPVGYFIAVLVSFAAILMIISVRFQRKK